MLRQTVTLATTIFLFDQFASDELVPSVFQWAIGSEPDLTAFNWEGCLQLQIFKDILTVNLPLVYSTDFMGNVELNKLSVLDRITFNLNFSMLNPFGYKQPNFETYF